MTDVVLEKLKYPIGRFQWVDRLSLKEIKLLTEKIRSFPAELEAEIQDYKPEDFQKNYRPGNWQIGQLTHHLADSHIHVYTRFKLGLTQETPPPYQTTTTTNGPRYPMSWIPMWKTV